ncbi:MAG: hypothetical protein HG439_000830 [candidate division SR1 bacterium]|nr:hypothetical protein [candidate division SR1 bacterium]
MKLKKISISVFLVLIFGTWTFSFGSFISLMEEHFSLARGNQSPTTFSSTAQREKNTDLRFLFAESERFLSQDINLLLGASDRETTLENYLIDGENILSSLNYLESSLINEESTITSTRNTCETQLNQANTLYSTSINSNDENGFLSSVESAKEARTCIAEQHVNLASLQALRNKRDRYAQIIDARVSYLRNNQDLIIRHYDILKPQLLSNLYKISVDLEQSSL